MANPYRVLSIPLDNAADRQELVGRYLRIQNLTVLDLPSPGVTEFSIHLGQRQAIPIVDQGFRMDQICPPEENGLFGSWPAQPGVTVRLYVGFGRAQAVVE